MMRLQKYLSICGVASRRKSEQIIQAGKISVNGDIITEMGYKVDPNKDIIKYDGQDLAQREQMIYILINKPTAYITTLSDEFNRKKIIDLVDIPQRIYPVGRLDYDTSGLLILTNDGELTNKLTHPKYKVEKVYIAKVEGKLNKTNIDAFQKGLRIENYITSPAKLIVLKESSNHSVIKITIREGRNRQVRKMCAAIGNPVIELKRIAIGKIKLLDLPIGKWRYLTDAEVNYLNGIIGAKSMI